MTNEKYRRLTPLRALAILEAADRTDYNDAERYRQLRAAMFEHVKSFHNSKRRVRK